MSNIFDRPEPDILAQYYDKGEGFWQKVKRHIQNVFRRILGEELLDYYERSIEGEDEDAYEEWMWWSDE